jgi:hypothetical protein
MRRGDVQRRRKLHRELDLHDHPMAHADFTPNAQYTGQSWISTERAPSAEAPAGEGSSHPPTRSSRRITHPIARTSARESYAATRAPRRMNSSSLALRPHDLPGSPSAEIATIRSSRAIWILRASVHRHRHNPLQLTGDRAPRPHPLGEEDGPHEVVDARTTLGRAARDSMEPAMVRSARYTSKLSSFTRPHSRHHLRFAIARDLPN